MTEKEKGQVEVKEIVDEAAPEKAKEKKPVNKGRLGVTVAIIVIIVAIAGVGFWNWHETPGFCNAFCHNMDKYYDTYAQKQSTTGTDKWGNKVSNTNAMLATLHRQTNATAKSEMACMSCHHAVLGEQISEGIGWVTGNYYDPLNERVGGDLTKWWGEDEDRFCANENCHVYLQGENGKIDRNKLEQSTSLMSFNPHSQHHEGIALSCTECHKGHRASVMMCTGCHTDIEIPEGWVTYEQNKKLVTAAFPG